MCGRQENTREDRFLSKVEGKESKRLNIRQVEDEDASVAKSCYKATWPFWVFVCCSLWLALFVNSTFVDLAVLLQAFPFQESLVLVLTSLCFTLQYFISLVSHTTLHLMGPLSWCLGTLCTTGCATGRTDTQTSSPWNYATVVKIPPRYCNSLVLGAKLDPSTH